MQEDVYRCQLLRQVAQVRITGKHFFKEAVDLKWKEKYIYKDPPSPFIFYQIPSSTLALLPTLHPANYSAPPNL